MTFPLPARLFLFLILFLSAHKLHAQDLDSLINLSKDEKQPESIRMNALAEYVELSKKKLALDSLELYSNKLLNYANEDNDFAHLETAYSGLAYYKGRKGKYEESIRLYLKRLDINTAKKNDDEICSDYLNIGKIYKKRRMKDSALFYYQKAEPLADKSEDLQLLSILYLSKGNLYNSINVSDSAVLFYNKSAEVDLKSKDLTRWGFAIINIGNVYFRQMDYEKAMGQYNRAISKLVPANEVVARAYAHNNIGMVRLFQSDFDRGIEELKIAADLRRKENDNRRLLTTYSYLSAAYKDIGNFEKSLKYLDSCGTIILGGSNPKELAYNYFNRGSLAKDMGDYKNALKLYKESVRLYSIAKADEDLPMVHNSIGTLYKIIHEFDSAALYFDTTAALYSQFEDQIGEFVVESNRGLINLETKKYKLAETHLRKAYKISKQLQSPQRESQALRILGEYHLALQNMDSAHYYYTESYKIVNEINLKRGLMDISRDLSVVEDVRGDLDSALQRASYLARSREEELVMTFPLLSLESKENYHQLMSDDFNTYHDIAYKNRIDRPEAAGDLFSNLLLVKGVLLRSSTLMRQTILNSKDSVLIDQYYQWLAMRRQMARLLSDGKSDPELNRKSDSIENVLATKSSVFLDFQNSNEISWKTVQSNLGDEESCIEFLRFGYRPNYLDSSTYETRYVGLIIHKDSKYPEIVDLFEESELEKIIGTFPGNNLSYIDQVYGSKGNTKSQLYDLIWKPMEKKLEGTKKVYISPVGLLHKISFAALSKKQDVYLCDNYEIEMMSSTGKLVPSKSSNPQAPSSNKITTLFGGIDYNSDSTTTEHWQYLHGSMSETQQIEKILKNGNVNYNYFNQSTATEAQFKEIASNSNILHIATHGFFYPDPELSNDDFVDDEESGEPINFRGGRTGAGVNTFVKSKNPLMRSGLAMAGANDVWHRTNFDGEDGVLTAAEVATIDMRNTELVVLSACETGLGDIKGSEGVYGLQRSFKMAGVKYLIMSLWQVPDKETAEFMTSFYENLTKTNDIKKSFSMTQAEMRKKYDPYYWAAFVLVE